MSVEKAKQILLGYDVYLADSSLLMPLESEQKPKIMICCPNQESMQDMEELLQALAKLEKQPEYIEKTTLAVNKICPVCHDRIWSDETVIIAVIHDKCRTESKPTKPTEFTKETREIYPEKRKEVFANFGIPHSIAMDILKRLDKSLSINNQLALQLDSEKRINDELVKDTDRQAEKMIVLKSDYEGCAAELEETKTENEKLKVAINVYSGALKP